VIAEGTVRSYDEPLHYWIEDAELNRVELEPHDEVEELLGHDIRVTGTFTFDPERGRLITIDDLEVVRQPPEA
jgi:hypothetical protein